MQSFKLFLKSQFFIAALLLLTGATQVSAQRNFDSNRARLLGHMVQQQLNRHHYSDKKLDDKLSASAYELYLKQLDGQKRFLLQVDIKAMSASELLIDDAIRSGRLDLPQQGEKLLNNRIEQVKKVCTEILAKGFDLDLVDDFETDPEKIDYAANIIELKERWRQILKYQTINRYLGLLEDELKTTEPTALSKVSADIKKRLLIEARAKVLKSQLSSL